MARMNVCESNRRIGGWLSNEFENDYIVTRDDGSEYRCFDNYDEAQQYLNYLQTLDNQDKLINEQKAIRASADALRAEQFRTNQLLEEQQRRTQDWERCQRWERNLNNSITFRERKLRESEEAKKRQAAENQQKAEEAKRQDREKFLLNQARFLCPKIDSGEVNFDYFLHREIVTYALCHSLYHFTNREPLWSLVENCYKYRDPFLNEIDILGSDESIGFAPFSYIICEAFVEQYELTDIDVHRLFQYALSYAQKNNSQNALNHFLAACTKNQNIFLKLFVWDDSFGCYDKTDWGNAIKRLLKITGTKGLFALKKASADPFRESIVSDVAKSLLRTLEDNCSQDFAALLNSCNDLDENDVNKVVDRFVEYTSGRQVYEIEAIVRDIDQIKWTRLSENLIKRLPGMPSSNAALFIFLWKNNTKSIKRNVVSKYLTTCIRKLGLKTTLHIASAVEGDKDKCDIVNAVRLARGGMENKKSLENRIQDYLNKLHQESNTIDSDEALFGEFRLKSRDLFNVFTYPVSAYDSLVESGQKLEPQRLTAETIARKELNFSQRRLNIAHLTDIVLEIQEETKIWYLTHVLPSSEIERRINALRLPPHYDITDYFHQVQEVVWGYIAAVISSRLNLESLSRGLWFSKRRREISAVKSEMKELYSRYAPKSLYKKSADLTVFAEFMSSLDPSIRFSIHQSGYRFRQILMKASGK